MSLTNNLKKIVDTPVWELMSQSPIASVAASAWCFGDGATERYIYQITPTAFNRYDTRNNTWQYLVAPELPALTASSMKYSTYGGFKGWVLGATANSLTVPAVHMNALVSDVTRDYAGTVTTNPYKVRIVGGTGVGQERTLVSASDYTIHDNGYVSAITTSTAITDSNKVWTPNQWKGYMCRITNSTGTKTLRKVIYNTVNILYFYDLTFHNTNVSGGVDNALLVGNAVGDTYSIESVKLTVDTNWTTTPDTTSKFMIMSGGIWLMTANASNFAAWQYYDILTDTWYRRSAPGGCLPAALATDVAIERMSEVGGTFLTGDVEAASARTVTINTGTVSVANFRYEGYQVRVTDPATGIVQSRRVIACQNVDADTAILSIEKPWTTTPDDTYTYAIYGDCTRIVMRSNALPITYNYNVEADLWSWSPIIDYGIANSGAVITADGRVFNSTAPATTVTGIRTVAVNVPGTGYTVGDIVTITQGAQTGQIYVKAINTTGGVTAVEIRNPNTGYTAGTKATTGGTGVNLTVDITVGDIGTVTTINHHNIQMGETVTFKGYGGDWAGGTATGTVICIFSTVGFYFIPTGTTPAAPSTAAIAVVQAVAKIVDVSKNWTIDEHKGKIAWVCAGNTFLLPSTATMAVIASNTATELVLSTNVTLPVNGGSRYFIQELDATGAAILDRTTGRENYGFATSGSATTLVDTTKSWVVNQWAGATFKVISGTGFDKGFVTVTSNDATTLNFGSLAWSPDSTTRYRILDTFGVITTGAANVLTDSTKKWPTNFFVGKRLLLIGGGTTTATSMSNAIASNTANTITTTFTSITGGAYVVLDIQTTGLGGIMQWVFNNSDVSTKGKYIFTAHGGGVTSWSRLNLNTDRFDTNIPIMPQYETLSTGCQYAYDGVDGIYFQTAAPSLPGRIYCLDVNYLKVNGALQMDDLHGAVLVGNRMEILETDDGLRYLYLMQQTGQKVYRALLF